MDAFFVYMFMVISLMKSFDSKGEDGLNGLQGECGFNVSIHLFEKRNYHFCYTP